MVTGIHESGTAAIITNAAVGEAAGEKLWSLVGGCSLQPAAAQKGATRINPLPFLSYLLPKSYQSFPLA